jgi:hypothetical protein
MIASEATKVYKWEESRIILTPCSRVIPEKLTRPKLLKKFPAFYGKRWFITALTRACHRSLPWARSIQSMPPPSNLSQVHFNIIPSTPGSIKWSPSLRFPHKSPVCTSPLPHTCHMSCPSQSSWLDHPNDIWWGVQSIKLLFNVVFSTPLLPHPSWAQIYSSALYSRKPSDYIPPSMWVTKFHTHIKQPARL